MFPIVAEKYKYIIGVDTHAAKHVATIINNQGIILASREIRVTNAQMKGLMAWVLKLTSGISSDLLMAIEGTSSYGETLTKLAISSGLAVAEVKPPKIKSRGGDGKTDHLDSELAALSVMRLPVSKLITPRMGSARKSLRILLMARRGIVTQRVASKNALIALLRGCELGLDARKALKLEDYHLISLWQIRSSDNQEQVFARYEAKRLASNILKANIILEQNLSDLKTIAESLTPGFINEPGVGPITAAQVICSYSHKGRVHSAEAFAALAGTTPIPASSGNVVRHRLNRYGDRALNEAIHTIALSRMLHDEVTKTYTQKRTADGLSSREIRRSLKRYIARSLYKKLETYNIQC